MLRVIDVISDQFARIAAALFFLIGLIISFEVVARYVFLSPTSWAEEGARLLQLWATYLAMGYVLRVDGLIRITVLTGAIGPAGRRLLEILALVWILVFCCFAFWLGLEVVIESIQKGRATATMNQVPKFWTETAIPAGFFVLALQTLAQIWRQIRARPDDSGPAEPAVDMTL
ncbi:MAG: C4-dicarboxylate ABC transporter substrate-binding protein [Pseudooceanicola sp.]|nr:C4-dicarboxylate ABC transporter substrate-binding protein [Pseudooceanicola sp.]